MAADDLGSDFADFITWRDAKRQAEAEQDFEVPVYEKSADGSERSVTLPYSHAKKVLGSWWPDLFGEVPEGSDDGGTGSGKAGGGKPPAGLKDLFAGGKRPAPGAKTG